MYFQHDFVADIRLGLHGCILPEAGGVQIVGGGPQGIGHCPNIVVWEMAGASDQP